MTEKQRQAFILYYKHGYSQREIADMLRISKQSVYERLEGAVSNAKRKF